MVRPMWFKRECLVFGSILMGLCQWVIKVCYACYVYSLSMLSVLFIPWICVTYYLLYYAGN